MKDLYLECNMGIAGDMLLSALVDLQDDRESTVEELNAMGIEGVEYRLETKETCGIYGTHIRVLVGGREEESHDHHHDHDHHHGHDHHHDHDHHDHHHDHDHHHEHHHAGMKEITEMIDSLQVSDRVKADAKAVYQRIAQAESRVHRTEVEEIHFHEVGTKDAVADIAGCAYMMEKIGADRIICSPIVTGYGKVRCAHGILPVPAPATALLLEGIPSCAGSVKGELTTPTGAALAGYYAQDFSQRPLLTIDRIGYGIGTKEFDTANCVRAFLGSPGM